MIRAGDLRDRITVRRAQETRDSLGQVESSWTEVASLWAQRQTLSLREVNRMAGMTESAEAKFLVRHRDDLDTGMRVEHQGTTYGVTAVETIGFREGSLLFVRRVG